jgi:hypothetical protein
MAPKGDILRSGLYNPEPFDGPPIAATIAFLLIKK